MDVFKRAHCEAAPEQNGVATSSSPFRSLSRGDEDIAAPKTIHTWGRFRMCPLGGGVAELLIENKLVVG
jgi:hypothetical protein